MTEKSEKKEIVSLPKEEQFPWSLLTGACILFCTGLVILLEGTVQIDALTQIGMFVAAVVVFGLGGYYLHSYHRWLVREIARK